MVRGLQLQSLAGRPGGLFGGIVTASFVVAAVAAAGQPAWKPVGPTTAETRALAIDATDPRVIWAIASDGAYRSSDSGTTWSRKWAPTAELPDLSAAVELEPAHSGSVYLQAGESGLLHSTDGGETWELIDPGVEPVLMFSYPRTVPFTLLVVGPRQKLVRSEDGGTDWDTITSVIDPDHQSDPVQDLAALPASTGVLYASTQSGLYRTTDDGASWVRTLEGDYDFVAAHPDEPDVVYTVVNRTAAHLKRSDDGGQTWVNAGTGLSRSYLADIAFDKEYPARLWAATFDGLFRSNDRGVSWTAVEAFGEEDWLEALAVDAAGSGAVAVGGLVEPPGVSSSSEFGVDWSASAVGLPVGDVGSIAVDPFDARVLYATNSGLYRSRDLGATWELLTRRGYGSVAVDPLASGVIYAAAWTGDLIRGFVKSTDGGASWTTLALVPPTESTPVWELAVDHGRAGTVYAGMGTRLYRSDNGGDSWTRLDAGPYVPSPAPIVLHPQRAGVLFVPGNGVHRSTDFGATWILTNEGLWRADACTGPKPCRVDDIAFDPFHADVVFLASECGLFRSDDSGSTWQPSAEGMQLVGCVIPPDGCSVCDGPTTVAASAERPGVLAAVTSRGVYLSEDSAATWRPLGTAGLGDPLTLWQSGRRELVVVAGGRGVLVNPVDQSILGLSLDGPRTPRGRLP